MIKLTYQESLIKTSKKWLLLPQHMFCILFQYAGLPLIKINLINLVNCGTRSDPLPLHNWFQSEKPEEIGVTIQNVLLLLFMILLFISVRWRHESLQHPLPHRSDQPRVADCTRFSNTSPGTVYISRTETALLRARVSSSYGQHHRWVHCVHSYITLGCCLEWVASS